MTSKFYDFYCCDGISETVENCFWYHWYRTNIEPEEIPKKCPNCGARVFKTERSEEAG